MAHGRRVGTDSPVTYEDVRWLRAQASQLKRFSEQLFEQAQELEERSSSRPLLGGKEIWLVAEAILAEHGEMHYTKLLAAIEEGTGKRVRGLDPAGTLLANLQRDPAIEKVPPARSGFYRLLRNDG